MTRPVSESDDDARRSWQLAIAEMRRSVFDWRKIEAALERYFNAEDEWWVRRDEGELIAGWSLIDDDDGTSLNLTALAKHLSVELGGDG